MGGRSRSKLAVALSAALIGCGGSGSTDDVPSDAGAAPEGGAGFDAGEVRDSGIQSGTSIVIADGELAGAIAGGARHFFGIPYAKPPVGELRFRAPVDVDPWTGVLDATAMSGRCAQPSAITTGEGTDNEDCLYLNVWSPDPAPTKPLPVLVWIHGGGNETGSTSDLLPVVGGRLFYDGESFAAAHEVVVVSMNYRLGPLGYLSHPALRDEGSPSGNQGLLDQRMALEWVRDNIVAFGGDPENVTIFGESAGARNVCYHVVSPKSRGLFHRAISQSGDCTGNSGLRTRDEAEAEVPAYVETVGCGDATDVLGCLRDKPAAELIVPDELAGAATDPIGGSAYSGGTPRWIFRPTVDGDFVPRLPRDLFADGEMARVPYLMGTNTEEGALAHLTATPAETEADLLLALDRRYGAFATRVADTYPVSDFATPNDALIRITTDERYACSVQDFAERAVAAGLSVYVYNFDLDYAIPGLGVLGPAHAAELAFVFHSVAPEDWPPGAEAISVLMQGYWSEHARSGDPNFADAPEWPQFDPALGTRLNLDLDPHAIERFRSVRCELWKEYYDASYQAVAP